MRALLPLLLAAALPLASMAQETVEARVPVYGQVISFPLVFTPAPIYEFQTPEGFFLSEWVPQGETAEVWTQMQTLTGHRGVGAGQDAAAAARLGESIAAHFLDGYRNACQVQVDALPLPLTANQNSRASFAAYLGCAHVAGTEHSEEMVILVMVGATDSYTLQWAERGPARDRFDRAAFDRWRPRIDALSEARLCIPAPGEPEPYPSCD
jgi:hypothetical protein